MTHTHMSTVRPRQRCVAGLLTTVLATSSVGESNMWLSLPHRVIVMHSDSSPDIVFLEAVNSIDIVKVPKFENIS